MFNLFLPKLPGNKFVNSMMFGIAEALAVVFSGILMSKISDTAVYNLVIASGVIAYLIFPPTRQIRVHHCHISYVAYKSTG